MNEPERAKARCQHQHWSGSGPMPCVYVAGHAGKHRLADSDVRGHEFDCQCRPTGAEGK